MTAKTRSEHAHERRRRLAPPHAAQLLAKAGFALSVFVLVSPAILVFLWMLSLSLKNEVDNTAWPPVFIPSPPTLANYVEVFARNNFLLYLWNSILVTGARCSSASWSGSRPATASRGRNRRNSRS